MRIIASLILLLLTSFAGAAVTNKAIDVSANKATLIEKQWQETLTTTEQTLTVTVGYEDRKIQVYTTTNAWGISNATGAIGTKKPIDPKQVDTITIVGIQPGDTVTSGTTRRVFYWQAVTTGDTIYIAVVE